MANTVIQLKYSDVTNTPTDLAQGEAAYSNSSSKLFIGLSDGSEVAIGGAYYTGLLDAATSAATPDTLVLRDAQGSVTANIVYANIVGTIEGVAESANKWTTAIDFGLAGDATGNVSVDGSENETLTVTLANSGVDAGTYGGASNVGVFTVDAKGRITSASNVAISSTLSISDGSNNDSVSLISDTLTFTGGAGIDVTVSDNQVQVNVDNTIITTAGGQTIGGDLTVSGNLLVSGETVTTDVSTIVVEDSLVKYANGNAGDGLDIGFYGQYNDGSDKYTAFFRDASDSGKFKILTGGTAEPSAANSVDPATYTVGTLVANIEGGTVSGLSSDIAVADGGTGAGSFTAGAILIGNGTGALQTLSNSSYTLTGGLAAGNTVTSLTVDDYGRVTAATGAEIAIAASQVTSGTLPVARGGTNQTSFTGGQFIYFDGTSLASIANTGTAGVYGQADETLTVTTDAYGRVSAVSQTSIAIATTAVTSGTFGVARGGTGASTFSTNGVIVSGATGTSALSAVTSATEGHVLQINASGVPVFGHINGGSF